ncbi:hypothetical protein H2Y54_02810 [Pectobacterium aroidearum]|uniref:hypothetical protein n=1 Tax=Pectobacterium aroidearum TaxID=1201031 RepID=UPI0015EFE5A3|nr:hypothetical protein [Pectobacterium aroidearum]MBA5235486.1 hypothetical protein [Pectobacterium aroidearum]
MDKKALLLRLNQSRQQLISDPALAVEPTALTVPDITPWQAQQRVRQYQHQWHAEQTALMLTECRQRLLHSIIGPFGLGTIVSAWDKLGGNVDTIHNVRAGVYVTGEEHTRYVSRGKYNPDPYHEHENYKKTNARNSAKKKSGEAVDAYTGQTLGRNTNAQQDHLISAESIHNDPAVWLAESKGVDLANHGTNLHQTHHSINESKQQKSTEEYIAWLNKNRSNRDVKIARLEEKAKVEPLSKKEQNALEKYKQQNAVDQEKMRELDEAARKQYESSLRWGYYGSAKFGTYLLKTSAIEAGKMGMQQAIGLVLTDFVDGLLLEIHDSWHSGFCNGVDQEHVWDALKIRSRRVASQCLNNWRNVLTAFRDGAISGVISNLMTTLINTFFTTARNLVRMIREGVFSLFRAAKTVLMRPEGTSRADALDAGLKIAISGAYVIGGVLLEEYLSKTLSVSLGVQPGGLITSLVAVLAGCVTGLGTVLTVYMLDRIDLFGAQHQKEDSEVLTMLQKSKAEAKTRLQALLGSDPEPAG